MTLPLLPNGVGTIHVVNPSPHPTEVEDGKMIEPLCVNVQWRDFTVVLRDGRTVGYLGHVCVSGWCPGRGHCVRVQQSRIRMVFVSVVCLCVVCLSS